ncbi:MAG: hypothetical protein M1823_005934 [Watsoniomyces obsoletus]|nr:MAG: hypothetical protein M1823_005934 [Watsoniomyces obsoletus]
MPTPKSHTRNAFATFLILCTTTFFLGILFAQLPYDYAILFSPSSSSSSPSSQDAYTILETHLRQLHASPAIVPRILHIVISVGLLGFFIKLYKPSESNTLFDGASLFLYMCGLTVYVANIVKGLRVVTEGVYGLDSTSGGSPGDTAQGGIPKTVAEGVIGREDSLRVLSASNTILALILVGVLGLQAGQWYAERKDEQEMMSSDRERRGSRKGSLANVAGGSEDQAVSGGDGNDDEDDEEDDDVDGEEELDEQEVSVVGTATGGDIGGGGIQNRKKGKGGKK